MTRILFIAGAAIAAMTIGDMSFNARSVQAAEGPWCALIAVAQGAVYEDSPIPHIRSCRSVVLAGNRGFCNQNPRWTGPVPTKRAKRRMFIATKGG